MTAPNRLNRYQDKAKLTSMGKYKIGTDFWISHGIGRDLEFSLRKMQGRGEVENVEINLMMENMVAVSVLEPAPDWTRVQCFQGVPEVGPISGDRMESASILRWQIPLQFPKSVKIL